MKYALVSDIHANLPALEAVLAHIETQGVDATYHLGDLVGYGPWPNETVAALVERAIPGVAGNYDSTVASGYKHCGCRYEDPRQEELSHESFEWTLAYTNHATKQVLGALPFRVDVRPLGGHIAGPTLTLVHGNQSLNTVYVTESRSDDSLNAMASAIGARSGDIVAFGHTHKPWERLVNGVHFVNAGSVGRPKDGDWRAGYVLLDIDADAARVEYRRVEYDVDRTAEAIIGSALPDEFAHYLRSGGTSLVPV